MKKAEFIKLVESKYEEITAEEWYKLMSGKCLMESFEDSGICYFKEKEIKE